MNCICELANADWRCLDELEVNCLHWLYSFPYGVSRSFRPLFEGCEIRLCPLLSFINCWQKCHHWVLRTAFSVLIYGVVLASFFLTDSELTLKCMRSEGALVWAMLLLCCFHPVLMKGHGHGHGHRRCQRPSWGSFPGHHLGPGRGVVPVDMLVEAGVQLPFWHVISSLFQVWKALWVTPPVAEHYHDPDHVTDAETLYWGSRGKWAEHKTPFLYRLVVNNFWK